MSEQMQFLANLIRSAKREHPVPDGVVKLLRSICRVAADAAPVPDLVRMAECLHELGMDATRQQAEQN